MLKLLPPSLLLLSLVNASDYDRANQAAKEALKGLDCDFDDCPKEAPKPQVIIKEKIVEKPVVIIQEKVVEKVVEKPVYIEREVHTPQPQPSHQLPSGEFHSCQDIKNALPYSRSGNYDIVIDNKRVNVFCEMISGGGGWTRVWIADRENYQQSRYDYDLPYSFIENSTYTMIAFSTQDNRLMNPWYFKTPREWKVQHPLSYSKEVTNIEAIEADTGRSYNYKKLFYGIENFSSACHDAFKGGGWGKLCISGTSAPFYASFNHPENDFCNKSNEGYNTVPCRDNRFVIFMK